MTIRDAMTAAATAVNSPQAHPAAWREAGLVLAASFRHRPRSGEITTMGSPSSGLPVPGCRGGISR
jgi:hypothetical protein